MEAIYHWVGVTVVWGVATFLLGVACFRVYTNVLERHWGNAILWVRVFVFRKRWKLTRERARILTAAYQKTKQLARWERNIIAYSVRQCRPSWPPLAGRHPH
jgi:hypothetical protein